MFPVWSKASGGCKQQADFFERDKSPEPINCVMFLHLNAIPCKRDVLQVSLRNIVVGRSNEVVWL
eukprot:267643-Amphidinium_carterae.4